MQPLVGRAEAEVSAKGVQANRGGEEEDECIAQSYHSALL